VQLQLLKQSWKEIRPKLSCLAGWTLIKNYLIKFALGNYKFSFFFAMLFVSLKYGFICFFLFIPFCPLWLLLVQDCR